MEIASRIAVWNRFAARVAETLEIWAGGVIRQLPESGTWVGRNFYYQFMQIHPVWRPPFTRPTDVRGVVF
jgi:hypothetical protein